MCGDLELSLLSEEGGMLYGEVCYMGRCAVWGGVLYGEVCCMGRCVNSISKLVVAFS